uniref:Uncharacterized protein n=1 Tax=Arundo donax TaxID=35708 RepID=A0A0A9EQI9_ARUDO
MAQQGFTYPTSAHTYKEFGLPGTTRGCKTRFSWLQLICKTSLRGAT